MSVREMGPYVLLHKLAEDGLSETYRAGLKSGDDVERVVLLCILKAGREDVDWITETASVGRRALLGLQSPHLADYVDSGELDGSAFLAYDYISGITLSRLMEASRREGLHLPLELAILVIDRAAKGLSAAWDHESRMLHGFLVPPLIMVSSDGEIRLLGFEVASRLRRLFKDQGLRRELGVYLAPEIVPEGQPATTDDVYSLGATLFELATGSRPPAIEAELEQAVSNARLADGGDMPEEIRELLASSLAPPQRRSTLQTWSDGLNEIVLSGRYEATNFNLAFFLHRLFGEELEAEAAGELTVAATPAAVLPDLSENPEMGQEDRLETELEARLAADFDSPTDSSGFDEAEEDTFSPFAPEVAATQDQPSESAGDPRKRWFGIAASIAVLMLAVAGTAYFKDGSDSATGTTAELTGGAEQARAFQPQSQPPAVADTEQLATAASGDAAAASPDLGSQGPQEAASQPAAQPQDSATINQRIDELVAERAGQREASLRDEYENQIDDLRSQLEEAQRQPPPSQLESDDAESDLASPGEAEVEKVQAIPLAGRESRAALLAEETREDSSTAALEVPAGTTVQPAQSAAGEVANLEAQATPPPGAAVQAQAAAAAESPSAAEPEKTTEPAANSEQQVVIEPVQAVDPPTQPEAEPAAQIGDLVTPGPGVTPPKLVKSVQPSYPIMARRLNREAVITVRVLVDEKGRVSEVEQLGEPAGYGFDDAAIRAAQKMTWQPATKDDVEVKMWWTVRIAFTP